MGQGSCCCKDVSPEIYLLQEDGELLDLPLKSDKEAVSAVSAGGSASSSHRAPGRGRKVLPEARGEATPQDPNEEEDADGEDRDGPPALIEAPAFYVQVSEASDGASDLKATPSKAEKPTTKERRSALRSGLFSSSRGSTDSNFSNHSSPRERGNRTGSFRAVGSTRLDEASEVASRTSVTSQTSLGSTASRLLNGRSRDANMAKWLRRPAGMQFFGVARHCERADAAWATVQNQAWYQSPDFARWPSDPPLSDKGLLHAAEVAEGVLQFTMENRVALDIVVTSPYFRCVQTAAEICRVIGPTCRLLIDSEFGEVFGPEVFGDIAPSHHMRDKEEVRRYCKGLGVRILPYDVGAPARWPESLQAARRRFANRFLTYLHKSRVTRKSFIVITHADAVGAALSMMPSFDRVSIERVNYGGMFLARRSLDSEDMGIDLDSGAAEASMRASATNASSDAATAPPPEVCRSISISSTSSLAAPKTVDGALKAIQGWSVCMSSVETVAHGDFSYTFLRRAQNAALNGSYSQDAIEDLLGGLAQKPLGDDDDKSRRKWVGQPTKQSELELDLLSPRSSLILRAGAHDTEGHLALRTTSPIISREITQGTLSPDAIPEDGLPTETATSTWSTRESRLQKGLSASDVVIDTPGPVSPAGTKRHGSKTGSPHSASGLSSGSPSSKGGTSSLKGMLMLATGGHNGTSEQGAASDKINDKFQPKSGYLPQLAELNSEISLSKTGSVTCSSDGGTPQASTNSTSYAFNNDKSDRAPLTLNSSLLRRRVMSQESKDSKDTAEKSF